MNERPILFSGAMVRAILEGRKTQTRRVVKTEPDNPDWLMTRPHAGEGVLLTKHWGRDAARDYCPYGQQRLWVREEHYRFGHWEAVPGVKTKTGRMKWRFVADTHEVQYGNNPPAVFRKGRHHKDSATPAWHKRLARFMPRAASLITLEITGLWVERLQDISEEDAMAEGVPLLNPWVWVISFRRVKP